MKMHWIYFIFIKDGGGEDIGKENFFFGGGWREFPRIHSRSKPCIDDVLRYLDIKGPSKHSCIWWYKESKKFKQLPRGIIVPEDDNSKDNNISVIPLLHHQINSWGRAQNLICPKQWPRLHALSGNSASPHLKELCCLMNWLCHPELRQHPIRQG